MAELRDGKIREFVVNPIDLGFNIGNLDDISVRSPMESAKIIEGIFAGNEKGTARDIAIINAAGALVVAGIADDLKQGVELSTKTLDSGKAAKKMEDLKIFTQTI